MNNNSLQLKHSLTYGAVFGSFILIILLFRFFFGLLNNAFLGTLAPTIFVFGAYIATRHYRDKLNDGFVTYGKAFGTSVLACVVMGFIWSIYSYVLYKYFSPGLLTEEIETAQELLLNKGFSEELIEKSTASMSPGTMAFGYLFNSLLYGALLSLINAALLKRNMNPLLTEPENEF